MNISIILYCIINTVFVLIVAPLFMGVIKKTKAYMQGRDGSSIFQPYYNIIKLFKKESVYSKNSSWITRIAPYVNMIVLVAASVFIPFIFVPGTSFVAGGLIVLLYLLALAKFFMVLGGLDAGSTFGGMGSSREMSISTITEPVLFVIIAGLMIIVNSTDTFQLFSVSIAAGGLPLIQPISIMLVVSLGFILFVETSRIPIDNPETHLELTMIHEGMLLEQSGKNLALMEWSHSIKQIIIMALIIGIAIPSGLVLTTGMTIPAMMLAILVSIILIIIKLFIFSIIIGIIESILGKVRLFRIPTVLAMALFLSFVTILIEVFV